MAKAHISTNRCAPFPFYRYNQRMFAVRVFPIAKGIPKEELTYFCAEKIVVGTLIEVPLRKKNISAIVFSCLPINEVKFELKQSDFSLRKINRVKAVSFLPSYFLETIEETAQYHAASSGAVLFTAVPKVFIEAAPEQSKEIKEIAEAKTENVPTVPVKISSKRNFHIAIETEFENQLTFLKQLIRKEFSQKHSVLIISPLTSSVKKIYDALKVGITDYAFTLDGSSTQRKILETIEHIKKTKEIPHSLLLVATPQYACFTASDTKTIVIMNERSRAYVTISRPYIDYRILLETLAKRLEANIYNVDSLLRTETVARIRTDEIEKIDVGQSLDVMSDVESQTKKVFCIDMKQEDALLPPRSYTIISQLLNQKIKESLDADKKIVLLGGRKGLAPATICGDCGTRVSCPVCSHAMVLTTKGQEKGVNIFMCNICGRREDTLTRCITCQSWKLVPVGIGTELIEKEIKKTYPDTEVFRFDGDTVKTKKQADTMISKWMSKKESILICTEKALPYIEHADIGAVVSIDSLFTIPDFSMGEKIFSLLHDLTEKTLGDVYIQTRKPKERILTQFVESKNKKVQGVSSFFDEEIADRKIFGYPPFKTLIKITLIGKKEIVKKDSTNILEDLAVYKPTVFPAFIPQPKGKHALHVLIKIDSKLWPDKNICEYVKSLPMQYQVRINPQSML